jgi:CheY-like chemotaxis protein
MSSPALQPARPVVVVADDEPMMRALLRRTLEPYYHVVVAADGQQALELVWGLGADVRVVITDMQMPRLTGLELAAELAKLEPAPAVLFISGFTGPTLPGEVLTKPFRTDALVGAVSRLLGQRAEHHQ